MFGNAINTSQAQLWTIQNIYTTHKAATRRCHRFNRPRSLQQPCLSPAFAALLIGGLLPALLGVRVRILRISMTKTTPRLRASRLIMIPTDQLMPTAIALFRTLFVSISYYNYLGRSYFSTRYTQEAPRNTLASVERAVFACDVLHKQPVIMTVVDPCHLHLPWG